MLREFKSEFFVQSSLSITDSLYNIIKILVPSGYPIRIALYNEFLSITYFWDSPLRSGIDSTVGKFLVLKGFF